MNRLRSQWAIAGLAALAGALAALLVVEYLGKAGPRVAFGQEGGVSANYVLAMLGATVNDATPIVLVDTKAQTILVYEYMVSRKMMLLRSVRTYAFDKEITDGNFYQGDYAGPSVQAIQNLLRSMPQR